MPVNKQNLGYYRLPSIAKNQIVFVSEDDLWTADLSQYNNAKPLSARRLSANPGSPTLPVLSPDGKHIAFISRDEGMTEIYLMPAEGGSAQRITFLGSNTRLIGWHPHKTNTILFISDHNQPFLAHFHLYEMKAQPGAVPKKLPIGPAFSISYNPHGQGAVISRNGGGRRAADPAMWKRYRGGTAGQIWIDRTGKNNYERILTNLNSDLASPMWIGKRIYFISDHENIANIYSCTPTGKNLVKHTHHKNYFVRLPKSDGRKIIYTAGAEVFVYDPADDSEEKIPLQTPSTFPQRNRKFINPANYLESYRLHPRGHSLCVTSRGKPFSFALWEGAVNQRGKTDCSARYRMATFMADGETVATVSDETGEERITLIREDGAHRTLSSSFDLGRVVSMHISPNEKSPLVAIANHRFELILLDATPNSKRKPKIIDRSRHERISDFAWAPDGGSIVYSFADSPNTAGLRLYDLRTGRKTDLTNYDFIDHSPAFDENGEYLYFISYREFDPVYDTHYFDLGFPRGMRLMCLPLHADLPSPFEPVPCAPGASPDNDDTDDNKISKGRKQNKQLKFDLKGITNRLIALPLPEGKYGRIEPIPGKILFSSYPVEGSLSEVWLGGGAPEAKGTLEYWDLKEQKRDTIVSGITSFTISSDGKTLCYRAGNRLRAIKAGTKPNATRDNAKSNGSSRASGWIDLSRIRLSINPVNEWKQMFTEAWRLQRDQYWVKDMGGTDWDKTRNRYEPLINRISCRSEFSDLMWELQGELGTSHAYEIGGDYRATPPYRQGFLGADVTFDNKSATWRFTHIPQGDSWKKNAASPLTAPGINIKINDRLLAVNHHRLSRNRAPFTHLVNMADQFVTLSVADASGRNKREVTIRTLASETQLRYREWVENNRAFVHKQSRNKIGYVHIPDMGPNGYSQFHRYYHPELKMPALIVDVRYNGGGHVSQLILEKLLRKRVGYDLQRWGQPEPYPSDAVLGPITAITNQNAGSDGDIFSHCFKLFKIGTLIGTRTWGGVVGIWPRHALVDGSVTTQPEFSFWFKDVGFSVENYGTDPDITVEIKPQDYAKHLDTQLQRAVDETKAAMKKHPPKLPNFGPLPKPGKKRK